MIRIAFAVLSLFFVNVVYAQPQIFERNVARSKATLADAVTDRSWKDGETVSVQGNSAAGDGGKAFFIYHSAGRAALADDIENSPIFPNASGVDDYFELQDKNRINVQACGVLPNGSDMAAQLQAVMDAAHAWAQDEGIAAVDLEIPSGTYVIGSRLDIPSTIQLKASAARFDYEGGQDETTDQAILKFADGISSKTHDLPTLVGTFNTALPTNEDGFAGIWVQGAVDCVFNVQTISAVGIGILLHPPAGGEVVHCNFYNGKTSLTKVAVELRGNLSTGYCNENNFYGLNIAPSSSTVAWGTVVGVKFSTVAGGYKGQNNNRFYNTSFQVWDTDTNYQAVPARSAVLNRRYYNATTNIEYICTSAGTIATTPTHTSGSVTDSNGVEFTYVGPYFRSPVWHDDGCGGQNIFRGSRWESGYGPFAMIDAEPGGWTTLNDYEAYGADDNARAIPAVNELDISPSNGGLQIFNNSFSTYASGDGGAIVLQDLHKRIIAGSTGFAIPGFTTILYTNNAHSNYNAAGSIKLLKDAVFISSSSRFNGVFVKVRGTKKLQFSKYTPYSSGVGRLIAKPATERTAVNVTSTAIEGIVSSSNRNAAYNAFRTGTDSGPMGIAVDNSYAEVFVGLDVAVELRDLIIEAEPTGSDIPIATLDRYGPLNGLRYSPGTPSQGFFPVMGEIILDATGGGNLWKVETDGILAPAWQSGDSVREGELRENGGNVYAAQSAGTTGATAPTGTGSDIDDDQILWDFVDKEAVLRLVTGSGYASISIEDNASATTVASTQSDWSARSQFVGFGTNFSDSSNATPDHTNDHITLTSAGTWEVSCVVTLSGSVVSDLWELALWKNNGATQVSTKQGVNIRGAGLTYEKQVTISGLVDASANDTIELWVQRTNGTGTLTITNAVMTAKKVSD